MSEHHSRRTFLKGIGVAAAATLGTRTVGASRSNDRYIVDMSTTSMSAMGEMDVVFDLREEIGYAVVEGAADAMPADAQYAADVEIRIEVPEAAATGIDAEGVDEELYPLEWDKQDQQIGEVHETTTGEGARIGIVDDGVLGANPEDGFSHPDLEANVREDLSRNFTEDGEGPGPLADDHGTHVAGTAAAAANGRGVVGHAPDAEVVDLRVFSGGSASFGTITAAVIVGAAPAGQQVNIGTPGNPEIVEGAGCDVLNLSLGTAPLVPVEVEDVDDDGELGDQLPALPEPYVPIPARELPTLVDFVSASGAFAGAQGTLPIASAGNSGVDLDEPIGIPDAEGVRTDSAAPTTLPAEADGFMSVGATGPIGFGWPIEGRTQTAGEYELETPTDVELPAAEPAFFTNYGPDGVDVTAPGGNADLDALGSVAGSTYDLVLSTTFEIPSGTPEDARLETYTPSYGWKAGTSMSAPQVTGLAALLSSLRPDAGPTEIREQIEATAEQVGVGRAVKSTAPGADPNEATDGDVSGEPGRQGSPGGAGEQGPPTNNQLRSETYRGEGHIDTLTAVERFDD
jgi:hypothetical protein